MGMYAVYVHTTPVGGMDVHHVTPIEEVSDDDGYRTMDGDTEPFEEPAVGAS